MEDIPVVYPVPHERVALPSEVWLHYADESSNLFPLTQPDRSLVSWETARKSFGGLLILPR